MDAAGATRWVMKANMARVAALQAPECDSNINGEKPKPAASHVWPERLTCSYVLKHVEASSAERRIMSARNPEVHAKSKASP